MTARTVYVVTSGEYSDYTVDCVFEHRSDAEKRAGKWGQVEEFLMFGPDDDPSEYRRNVVMAWAVVDVEGRIHEDKTPHSYTKLALSDDAAVRSFQDNGRRVVAPVNYPRKGWAVTIGASTEEAAWKAVRERAAKVASLVVQGMDPMQMEEQ